jgi:protein subunit release factor B
MSLSSETSRSSGKGGQNVNKTETKVELIFSVPGSAAIIRFGTGVGVEEIEESHK